MSYDRFNKVLPVVADSWERLRRSDVHRFIDLFAAVEMPDAAAAVKYNRPDLADEADDCLAELLNEAGANH